MRLRHYAIVLIVSGLLVGAVTLVTALNPGYSITKHTHTASAGGVSTGANYQVRGSLGQPAVEMSTGTNYSVSSGIWTSADNRLKVYLPLVTKNYDPTGLIPGDVSDTCPGHGISVGRQVRENFDHKYDKDWYTFSGTAGTEYDLETFDLAANADTILFVFWGDEQNGCPDGGVPGDVYCPSNTCKRIDSGQAVPDCACNWNCGGGPHSCFTWEAPTTRDYRVYVRNWNWHIPAGWGANTHYSLRVSQSTGGALQSAGFAEHAGEMRPPGDRQPLNGR